LKVVSVPTMLSACCPNSDGLGTDDIARGTQARFNSVDMFVCPAFLSLMQAKDVTMEIAVEGIKGISRDDLVSSGPSGLADENSAPMVLAGFRAAWGTLPTDTDRSELLVAAYEALVGCPSNAELHDLTEQVITGMGGRLDGM